MTNKKSSRKRLQKEVNNICKQLRYHIENSHDGFIHTSNGEHIQIRSKDSQPYHPIYSSTYGRYVSNKNHAFYFQKQLHICGTYMYHIS